MEDVGDLIGRGFGTWRQNLNLCLPFLLSFVLSMLVVVLILASFAASLVPLESLNSTSVEKMQDLLPALEPALKEALPALLLAFTLLILLLFLVSAFFTAGAIGMAVQALETGRATTGAMWSAGRKHFVNMFLTSILMGIITMAGMIFLLPGIVLLPRPLQPEPQALGALLIGLVLLIIYALAMSLILALAPYALVVESLGPVRAVRASVNFFSYNKFDVLVL